jgi:hypothetical protein
MTLTTRVVAGAILLVGGIIVAVSALSVILARILVEAGMPIRSADAALLDDVVAVLPFVVAFAGANLAAAVGLLNGRRWADLVALGSATVAVVVGGLGLLLVIVGRDPFAPVGSPGSSADGIGILSAFTVMYLAVVFALLAARAPRPITTGAATA